VSFVKIGAVREAQRNIYQ